MRRKCKRRNESKILEIISPCLMLVFGFCLCAEVKSFRAPRLARGDPFTCTGFQSHISSQFCSSKSCTFDRSTNEANWNEKTINTETIRPYYFGFIFSIGSCEFQTVWSFARREMTSAWNEKSKGCFFKSIFMTLSLSKILRNTFWYLFEIIWKHFRV